MKVARTPADLETALATAQSEAKAAFGDDASISRSISTSRATSRSRCSATARANAVHLGERDCSLQRRQPKVWEEALSPPSTVRRRRDRRARVEGDRRPSTTPGAGTVEFLYENGEFYFIEMNDAGWSTRSPR